MGVPPRGLNWGIADSSDTEVPEEERRNKQLDPMEDVGKIPPKEETTHSQRRRGGQANLIHARLYALRSLGQGGEGP